MTPQQRSQIQAICRQSGLKDRLYLVVKGIPFDVAMSLDEIECIAWVIMLGELDGRKWDWANMDWEPQPRS